MKQLCVIILFLLFVPSGGAAAPEKYSLRIGFIGSLSGFAASYGTAVLDGVRLAEKELEEKGVEITLVVEDDQSLPKNLASAYQKLRSVDRVNALITGSWWIDSIVRTVERDGIPLLSCETLYTINFVRAPNYFSLLGDLRDWVRVYKPLVRARGWKTGTIVKFTSGFADTLRNEMKRVFSEDGRTFLPEIEYGDFEMKEASTIALQIKKSGAEVVYIDAQPSSFSRIMSALSAQQTKSTVVFANTVALDALKEKLFDPKAFQGELYFSARESRRPEFTERFLKLYGREPILNSDLGYYAVLILDEAFKNYPDNPVQALKKGGLSAGAISITFDENNVYRGFKQELFAVRNGAVVRENTAESVME